MQWKADPSNVVWNKPLFADWGATPAGSYTPPVGPVAKAVEYTTLTDVKYTTNVAVYYK